MPREPLDVVALFGSYRAERRGIRAVTYVRSRLEERGHRVAVVDAREVGLPILDRMYKEYPAGAAPESLERLAALYRAGGWPAEVEGDAFTAPYSAPSAGPPPWHLYRFTFHTAFGVAGEEPYGATRWRFAR